MGTVILFNTAAHHSRAVLVHDESCRLVAAARKSRGLIKVIEDEPEMRADFEERNWPVRVCKCARAIAAEDPR